MSERFEIWGPSTGSSLVRVWRGAHGRIIVHAQTDFGEAKCGFTDFTAAREIRDALNRLLGETA